MPSHSDSDSDDSMDLDESDHDYWLQRSPRCFGGSGEQPWHAHHAADTVKQIIGQLMEWKAHLDPHPARKPVECTHRILI